MFGFSLSNSFAETSGKAYGGREVDFSAASNYNSCLTTFEGCDDVHLYGWSDLIGKF